MNNHNYHSYITPINHPQIIPPYQQRHHAAQIKPHATVDTESHQFSQVYLPPQVCPAYTGLSRLSSSNQNLFPLILPTAQKQCISAPLPPQYLLSSSYNKDYHQTHSQPSYRPNIEFPVSRFDGWNEKHPSNYYSYTSPFLQPQQGNKAPGHPAQIEPHPSVQGNK